MKHLTILIGDSEKIFIEIISESLQEAVGSECKLRIYASHEAGRLLKLAESHTIDLFVTFLNNILFSDGNMPPEKRMRKVLRLISDVKSKYGGPIIAISGLPEYAQRAKEAGADYFFPSPFDLNEFRDAVNDCLRLSTK
jgi:CheY-like chemotaxis protein